MSRADFKSRGDRIRTRQYLPSKTPINQCFQWFEPFSVSCLVAHGNPQKLGLCQIRFYSCLINLRHVHDNNTKKCPRQLRRVNEGKSRASSRPQKGRTGLKLHSIFERYPLVKLGVYSTPIILNLVDVNDCILTQAANLFEAGRSSGTNPKS